MNNPRKSDGMRKVLGPVEVIGKASDFLKTREEQAIAASSSGRRFQNGKRRAARWYASPPNGTSEPFGTKSRTNAATKPEKLKCALQQSEKRFATVFQASPAILCIIHLHSGCVLEVNKAYEKRTGYSRNEVIGKADIKFGPWTCSEDREQCFEMLTAEGRIREYQSSFSTKAGELLTVLISVEAIEIGNKLCALVVAEDITTRVRAEEARLELAGRLTTGQELERTRIARELHDGIGQSLALFSIELEKARQAVRGLSTVGDARLKELSGKIKELGQRVSSLSRQLHSSELELLGLSIAVKGLCRDSAEQFQFAVNCVCLDVPDSLDSDIALALFRVTQEALHNVAKHGEAHNVDVVLRGSDKRLCLRIVDDGAGFDLQGKTANSGLGLISMRERMRLIGGEFAIRSKPGCGTTIEARARYKT